MNQNVLHKIAGEGAADEALSSIIFFCTLNMGNLHDLQTFRVFFFDDMINDMMI